MFNLRRQKLDVKSDNQEVELLSAAIVKVLAVELQHVYWEIPVKACLLQDGNKVVCGCGDGVLNIWSWGEWGDVSDRLPGHPSSIDACIPVTDNMVCTGCLDGAVRFNHQTAILYDILLTVLLDNRLVQIQPNRLCKVLGEHQEPVEQLRLSHDHGTVASCSHDTTVKFWDIAGIDLATEGKARSAKRLRKTGQALKGKRIKQSGNQEFFADL